MKIMTAIIAMATISLAVFGCSEDHRAKNNATDATDSSGRPDTELTGATIYLFAENKVTGEIVAETIHNYAANDSTMGYDLTISLFDSAGVVNSIITGDSGVIHESIGNFEIFGRVVVLSDDSSRLETDFLTWNQKTQKLRTDAFVRISDREGNLNTGWGMEASRNPTRYRILSRVSGKVRDADQLDK